MRPGRAKRAALAFTGLRKQPAKAADMRYLLDLAVQGRIRPVVDQRLPLAEAAAAHRYVEQGHKAGTLLLVVWVRSGGAGPWDGWVVSEVGHSL